MAFVDDVESLGYAVQTGTLDRADAAQLLIMSADGGLTEQGAALLIDDWQNACRLFEREFDRAADALKRLSDGMADDC